MTDGASDVGRAARVLTPPLTSFSDHASLIDSRGPHPAHRIILRFPSELVKDKKAAILR